MSFLRCPPLCPIPHPSASISWIPCACPALCNTVRASVGGREELGVGCLVGGTRHTYELGDRSVTAVHGWLDHGPSTRGSRSPPRLPVRNVLWASCSPPELWSGEVVLGIFPLSKIEQQRRESYQCSKAGSCDTEHPRT